MPIEDVRALEVCVDDVAGMDAAITGGADRLELCGALSVGGLSPAPALIAAAASAPVPTHMLVRPRDGGFHYTRREAAMMAADIDAAAQAGLAGVVIGASCEDATLDTMLLQQFIHHARRERAMSVTLHRAFDLSPDPVAALETAIGLGFDRVLTSGGTPWARDGLTTLAVLHRQAGGRITILAGSGITAATVASVLATGVCEIHASCARAIPVGDTPERRFGFVGTTQRRTDSAMVRELRAAMNRLDVSGQVNNTNT